MQLPHSAMDEWVCGLWVAIFSSESPVLVRELSKKGEYMLVCVFFAGDKEVRKVRDWAKHWTLLGKWMMPAFAVVFVISYFLYYV